tara:strand:- start:26022 stop:26231 length:210 start_codon:yes stop_codon:yes gene_type:complete
MARKKKRSGAKKSSGKGRPGVLSLGRKAKAKAPIKSKRTSKSRGLTITRRKSGPSKSRKITYKAKSRRR